MKNNTAVTTYPEINNILAHLTHEIHLVLKNNLVGLYLFGSLTYGDFNPDSSDIDLIAIVDKPMNHNELEQIKQLHKQAEELYKKWANRLECSYTPIDLFKNTL